MKDSEMRLNRLRAAERVVAGERIRWLLGKKKDIVEKGNVFGKTMTEARYELIMSDISETELERELVLMELERGPRGIGAISEATGILGLVIFKHIVMLVKNRRVESRGQKDGEEIYGPVKGGGK